MKGPGDDLTPTFIIEPFFCNGAALAARVIARSASPDAAIRSKIVDPGGPQTAGVLLSWSVFTSPSA